MFFTDIPTLLIYQYRLLINIGAPLLKIVMHYALMRLISVNIMTK